MYHELLLSGVGPRLGGGFGLAGFRVSSSLHCELRLRGG